MGRVWGRKCYIFIIEYTLRTDLEQVNENLVEVKVEKVSKESIVAAINYTISTL